MQGSKNKNKKTTTKQAKNIGITNKTQVMLMCEICPDTKPLNIQATKYSNSSL